MEKSEIAREILAYLADHPDAQDTLEGIMEWWLIESRIKLQIALVKEILHDLVENEFLLEINQEYTRVRYRMNQGKIAEIRALTCSGE